MGNGRSTALLVAVLAVLVLGFAALWFGLNSMTNKVAAIPTPAPVQINYNELGRVIATAVAPPPTPTVTATSTPIYTATITALVGPKPTEVAGTPTTATVVTGTPIIVTSAPKSTVVVTTITGTTALSTTNTCTEQMLGPWQPPQDKPTYDYVQVNVEFPDSDYLVSLSYQRGISLSQWLVQAGDGSTTEVVYTVRTSVKEVQFAQPRSGVAWRLCAHPDKQLTTEVATHASNIANDRKWLRVYNVGDLWLSLQTGDKNLISLIKCITPSTQGIPDCHTK